MSRLLFIDLFTAEYIEVQGLGWLPGSEIFTYVIKHQFLHASQAGLCLALVPQGLIHSLRPFSFHSLDWERHLLITENRAEGGGREKKKKTRLAGSSVE